MNKSDDIENPKEYALKKIFFYDKNNKSQILHSVMLIIFHHSIYGYSSNSDENYFIK